MKDGELRLSLNTLLLLLLLIAGVAGFWLVQPTSPERISSIVFLFLICFYALSTNRIDVLSASILFFCLADLNRYMINTGMPDWIFVLTVTAAITLIWLTIFGRSGWFLAIASILAVIEAGFSLQFLNISFDLQALLMMAPFAFICQYYYFRLHRPDY